MDQKQDEAEQLELQNGRILVKLKLPKMGAAAEEEDDAAESQRHYCHDCDRSFSSGKALGGHMSSAHVQASKGQSIKKLKLKTATAKIGRRASGAAAAAEIACEECGRCFSSNKALFGHMRCHPERSYRGMNSRRIDPPSDLGLDDEIQSGSQDRMNGLDNAMKQLKNWSVTGKRGRGQVMKVKPAAAAPSSVSSTEEEEVFHALIMLHRGDGHRKSQPSDEEEVKDNGSDLGEGFQKKKKITIDEEAEDNLFSDSSEDEVYLSAMIDLMKGARTAETPNHTTHTCIICNKSFTTHQALGGHMSSHSKIKVSIVNAADEAQENEEDDNGGGEKYSSSSSPHVCKMCTKSFGSGQALGGHMRSHFVHEQQQTGGRRLDLDLNKMPAQDEGNEV